MVVTGEADNHANSFRKIALSRKMAEISAEGELGSPAI
jgi:hypothetical protein